MSKYLTLIPLLREMCFPYHHSCLGEEKKKITILENGNFYVFSFGNWANVIWVMKMNSCIHAFPFNSIRHLQSAFVLHLFLFCVRQIVCVHPLWRKQTLSVRHVFFICFISISVYLARDKMAGGFIWQAPSLSCHVCLVSLLLHSKHTPPSIFLFFLNVIVKCSSEMTLNMCTLTEGIHLVIYFLPFVLRGLFIVCFSSSRISVFGELLKPAFHFKSISSISG